MTTGEMSRETIGTTVVIDHESLAREIREQRGGRVVNVRHYLDALGEMAHQPVEVVIGRIEPMRETLDSAVRSLRKLAPRCQILLIAEPADEPYAIRAVRLGVDDYLVDPVNATTVLERIHAAHQRELPVRIDPVDSPAADSIAADDSEDEAITMVNLPVGLPLLDELSVIVDELLKVNGDATAVMLNLISRRHGGKPVQFLPEPPLDNRTCVDVRLGTECFGYLAAKDIAGDDLQRAAHEMACWLLLERHQRLLESQAYHDDLTGIHNRRYFDKFFPDLVERARQERFRVTLMLYDIDDFKSYNDQFGHGAGDEILCETAKLMKGMVREQDVVARIGGDEFAVVFWDAEPPRRDRSQHPREVRNAAERFQKAVVMHQFEKLTAKAPGPLTISGGLASYPWDGRSAEDLIKAADAMMLHSKREGKNVLTFGPGVDA